MYLRARYYDPTSGQFISRDPIEDITREPYAYTGGNPLQYTDPLGLWWSWDDIKDFSAGAVDTVTFGGTKKIREWTGTEHWVNECSAAYSNGAVVGEIARDELIGMGAIALTGGVGYAAYKGYSYAKRTTQAKKQADRAADFFKQANRGHRDASPPVDDVLGRLPVGKQTHVRTVGSVDELNDVHRTLTRGGQRVEPPSGYKGTVSRRPDGINVGYRESIKYGPTIDISSESYRKVHIR